MPRPLRIRGNDIHYHVILKCNNGEYLLTEDRDFQQFLTLLLETKERFALSIYNYTLLSSHAHLIFSTHQDHFIDEVMHNFCTNYSRDFNKHHGRIGHLWRNRYWCRPIVSDAHALATLRYQHRNPDKAGMVSKIGEWKWCGYRFYTENIDNPLLTLHPSYMGLADDPKIRRAIYTRFVQKPLTAEECNLFEKRRIIQSQKFRESVQKHVTDCLLHEVSGSS